MTSRRDFMKKAGMIAAAAAIPGNNASNNIHRGEQ